MQASQQAYLRMQKVGESVDEYFKKNGLKSERQMQCQ